jgi:hypothetical protein
MDWSEATFNGLNVASLQNAAGNFVTPSATSIDDAMNSAVEQSNGTYNFDYDDTGNAAAYPMPMVTYAVVPAAGVPAAQTQSMTNFLTNLVAFSSGKDGTLPGGYVPLPSALATQATLDIAKDIKAAPATTSGSGGSASSTTSTSSGSSTGTSLSAGSEGLPGTVSESDGGGSLSVGTADSVGATGTLLAGVATEASGATHDAVRVATQKVPPSAKENVIDAGFDVIGGDTRVLIPVLLALALAAVVVGPLLLAWPRRRRRRAHVVLSGVEDEGPDQ